jgi:hypothetical protein
MPSKDNHGQQWIPGIQKGVEESFEARPLGMPCLSVLTTEILKLGLPASDAEDLYDRWLMSGFKMNNGRKIADWHAAVRYRWRQGYFPSQKRHAQEIQDDPNVEMEKIKAKFRRMQNGQ